MKIHAASFAVLALSASLALVVAQDRPAQEPAPAPPAGQDAVPQEREPDTRAITDLLASFVKAYNAKDAKAIGELFTPEAEIEDEDGDITRGHDAIVAWLHDTFAGGGTGTLSLDTESLRFLGTDLAIVEGTASLSTGTDSRPRTNRYSVIYARQGGRWLHARVRDEREEDVPAHERLRELEWLLGEWVNESDDEVVFTNCKWSDDGNYLLRDFGVEGRGPHRPSRDPALPSAGIRSRTVPHLGLRRQRRLRRGTAFARRRPLGRQGIGRPIRRTVRLLHHRDHPLGQGPAALGGPRPDRRRRGHARHRSVRPGPTATEPR